MIRRVKFSNFYSFKEEQEISFLTSKKRAYSYFPSNVKKSEQVTKVAGFVGGNASGKTNIMRLFSFLSHFVRAERRGDSLEIASKTFFNNKEKSDFFVEFEIDEYLYSYKFSIKGNLILKEELTEKRLNKKSKKETVFLRNKDKIRDLHEEYFKDFPINYLKNIRQDVSLLAFLKAHYDIDIINKINKYFSHFYFNINEHGQQSQMYSVRSIKAYLSDKNLKSQMEDFVRKFDIGLEGFEISEIKENSATFPPFEVFGIHKSGGVPKKIPLTYESRGTQALLFMLAHIFGALKNNGIVVIDELETGLHPEAVKKIVDYFIDENEKGMAQLIFSSHALDFMKKFDMQQIFLVEKDSLGSSCVYRLDDVDGIRTDENFLAKYMSGAYGSFPDIKV
jgi:AAA15 family ATPase/GTPase